MDEPSNPDTDESIDLERRIAALRQRWPSHSVPPRMWEELEELEDKLARTKDPRERED
jgi:hypothetical protein